MIKTIKVVVVVAGSSRGKGQMSKVKISQRSVQGQSQIKGQVKVEAQVDPQPRVDL